MNRIKQRLVEDVWMVRGTYMSIKLGSLKWVQGYTAGTNQSSSHEEQLSPMTEPFAGWYFDNQDVFHTHIYLSVTQSARCAAVLRKWTYFKMATQSHYHTAFSFYKRVHLLEMLKYIQQMIFTPTDACLTSLHKTMSNEINVEGNNAFLYGTLAT